MRRVPCYAIPVVQDMILEVHDGLKTVNAFVSQPKFWAISKIDGKTLPWLTRKQVGLNCEQKSVFFIQEWYWWFSHDVTKIQTTKLSIYWDFTFMID